MTAVVAEHHNGTDLQICLHRNEIVDNQHRLVDGPAPRRAADQHEGRPAGMAMGQQCAEVGVGTDQDAIVGTRSGDDHLVGCADQSDVADVNDVVSVAAKQLDELG